MAERKDRSLYLASDSHSSRRPEGLKPHDPGDPSSAPSCPDRPPSPLLRAAVFNLWVACSSHYLGGVPSRPARTSTGTIDQAARFDGEYVNYLRGRRRHDPR